MNFCSKWRCFPQNSLYFLSRRPVRMELYFSTRPIQNRFPNCEKLIFRNISTNFPLRFRSFSLSSTISIKIIGRNAPGPSTADELLLSDQELRKKITIDDRFDPLEWTLIYRNKKAETALWALWPVFAVVAAISVGFLCFLGVELILRLYADDFTKKSIITSGTGLFLSLGALYASTRWRRLIVFRIYQRKTPSKLVVEKGAMEKREYCIIWYNVWRWKRKFFYNHFETSGACEKLLFLPRANFYARNRGWCVQIDFFFKHQDYFFVRSPKEVG